MVVTDRYSGWSELAQLKHLDIEAMTDTLEGLFKTFSIPEKMEACNLNQNLSNDVTSGISCPSAPARTNPNPIAMPNGQSAK